MYCDKQVSIECFVSRLRTKAKVIFRFKNKYILLDVLVCVLSLRSFTNCVVSGAPNDGFLPNTLKRCFRLSGVLLKLCRLILGCAIKFVSVRFF